MKYSIVTILEFGMYGMPLMGADICGFHDEATEELCLRWHQMGAFYPFMRNHNDISSKRDQDPAAWSSNTTAAIKDVLDIRYRLLPYLYTLLYRAHVNGTPVARPLLFDYAHEAEARIVDDQFMWGGGLMVAPVITQGQTKRSVYFPGGRWYELLTHAEVAKGTGPRRLEVDLPLDVIGLYLRGGAVTPYQNAEKTTAKARKTPFGLLVALDEHSRACGSLYWDDGESEHAKYTYLEFEAWRSANEGGVKMRVLKGEYRIDPPLNTVTILGMDTKPSEVKLDKVTLDAKHVAYEPRNHTLYLVELNLTMNRQHEILWRFLNKEWV